MREGFGLAQCLRASPAGSSCGRANGDVLGAIVTYVAVAVE